jgi:hypothetical protein
MQAEDLACREAAGQQRSGHGGLVAVHRLIAGLGRVDQKGK